MQCPVCATRMDPWLRENGYTAHITCEGKDPIRMGQSSFPVGRTGSIQQAVLGECPHGEPRGMTACPYCRRYLASKPRSTSGVLDGPTQRAAAALALPKSGTKRRQLYEVVLAAGERGMTDTEAVIELGPGWDYSRLGPRRRELVEDGLLQDSGVTRPSPWTGSEQVVWRATVL